MNLEPLSEGKQRQVLRAIEVCHGVDSEEALKRYVQTEFALVMPHAHFACGVVALQQSAADAASKVRKIINVNFDPGYLTSIIDREGNLISPIFRGWRFTRSPCYHDHESLAQVGDKWLDVARRFKLRNIVGHGLLDIEGSSAVYFGAANVDSHWRPVQARLFDLLVPHLYVVLQRLTQKPGNNIDPGLLTQRQKEILKWVAGGKSNWEIGLVLGISEMTVRNHLATAMRKLNVHCRAHAVAKSIGLGFIQP